MSFPLPDPLQLSALAQGAGYLTAFAVLAAAERLWPWRRTPGFGRLGTNLGLGGIGGLIGRTLAAAPGPLAALGSMVAAAHWAQQAGFGVFNLVEAPGWLEIAAAIALLDLAVWAQHAAFHRIGPFWRLHAVHHADRALDVTSAVRFHPGELVVSAGWKGAVAAALGAAPAAVVAFELLLGLGALFTHAAVRLPAGLEARLRALIVTPDMHRIHHSVQRAEQDSNFGSILSVWDRLFRTHRAEPAAGRDQIEIGLAEAPGRAPDGLGWSLGAPFKAGLFASQAEAAPPRLSPES